MAVDHVFDDSELMPRRRHTRTWLPRGWAGPTAGVAGLALALHFGLIDSRPTSTAVRYQVGYQCWRNVYDCRDFRTQAEAQAVYRACGGPKKDVHHLDWHGNGRACDYLP